MRVRILDERAELRTLYEATQFGDAKASDFDWIDGIEEYHEPRLVKIRDTWYDACDMVFARPEWQAEGWDAEHVDTFYSAIVVKWLEGDDEGFLRVGEYVA